MQKIIVKEKNVKNLEKDNGFINAYELNNYLEKHYQWKPKKEITEKENKKAKDDIKCIYKKLINTEKHFEKVKNEFFEIKDKNIAIEESEIFYIPQLLKMKIHLRNKEYYYFLWELKELSISFMNGENDKKSKIPENIKNSIIYTIKSERGLCYENSKK